MRGEKSNACMMLLCWGGTPPRAWGKDDVVIIEEDNVRYTPTCVGKGATTMPVLFLTRVHPHVRGEKTAERP